MGLIHHPRQPLSVRKQFNWPINSYRQLYHSLPFPYLQIIHMECHMHHFQPVLQDMISSCTKKYFEHYPKENYLNMLL